MTCPDFDPLFDSDRAQDHAILREHAAGCADCRARLAWEERLAGAVRASRPDAPEDLLPGILSQLRTEREPAPRLRRLAPVRRLGWPVLVPVAAALVVAVSLWLAGAGSAPPVDNPHLLSEQARTEVRRDEAALARAGEDLMAGLTSPAGSERAVALLEEARHLDLAVEEVQRALAANPRSRHLNDRLLELSRRRNLLLEAARQESRG